MAGMEPNPYDSPHQPSAAPAAKAPMKGLAAGMFFLVLGAVGLAASVRSALHGESILGTSILGWGLFLVGLLAIFGNLVEWRRRRREVSG
jgi:hypothetical protein